MTISRDPSIEACIICFHPNIDISGINNITSHIILTVINGRLSEWEWHVVRSRVVVVIYLPSIYYVNIYVCLHCTSVRWINTACDLYIYVYYTYIIRTVVHHDGDKHNGDKDANIAYMTGTNTVISFVFKCCVGSQQDRRHDTQSNLIYVCIGFQYNYLICNPLEFSYFE